ncbi:WecB/TagA/CpsF family glycosyltransferase [Humisphaera borealis]|uniref:WecB/TagA/CpsF family glycosyltransferase n=1 Tax=Humisphaera borealis TaxID=2807512 RepID=A0A7M2X0F9_9BACT|nr:WecB/TagA/CpsF family glycosyltransferase [Humisphaera borealis]QOV91163.1 WecB/TagA/CpsF family glycosyltransferase [Humisphaera borealis]
MFRRYGEQFWENESANLPDKQASRRSARRQAVQSPRARELPVVEIAGVELHAITEQQTIDHIIAELNDGRGGVVVTPNVDHIRRCTRDLQFHAMVSEADLAVPDGMPVIWASKIAGTPLPQRVAGSSLVSTLSGAAAKAGKSIFLLGGDPGAAEGAANVLQERFPGIKIAGIHFPPFGFEKNRAMWKELTDALEAAKPDIVYVALGAPKQEITIYKLRSLLPNAWFLGVGVSFSFLAGMVSRAPKWMQKTGLEWTHRLFQEPGKLWKRYIVAGIPFAIGLLSSSAMQGVPNRFRRWRYGSPDRVVAAPVSTLPPDGSDPARSSSLTGTGTPTATTSPSSAAGGTPSEQTTATASTPSVPPPPTTRVGRPVTHSVEDILKRLRAVILLGGSVRPSPLSAAASRSVLDLPLDENGSLLNFWLGQCAEVAKLAALEKLPIRVLVNHAAREPVSAGEKYMGLFRVERDLSEYRGTGGVLRDVTAEYAEEDFVLVANACQILLDPLSAITLALARQGGDVNLLSHDDGTPSGVQLLQCKTVRHISEAGYHDMKEQALPGISATYDVKIMRHRRPTGLPIRTLEDYMMGLRLYHRRKAGKPMVTDPLAEDWTPAFSLVEAGANVSPAARIHDSVVLAGATVESNAVVVRSLVCGDATVRTERTLVDQYVTAAPKNFPNPVPVAATW